MMERLLQHPTWLKVFSVALAILLWAMVMPKFTSDETALFEVPLHVRYNPDLQVDEGPKDTERFVTVRVSGKNVLVSRVRADLIYAEVDYTRVTEPGKQTELEVQVTYKGNLKGLTFAASPRTVSVVLIKNQQAVVPVDVVSPTPTYVMLDNREYQYTAKAETDQVRLEGRSDLLALVRSARVTLVADDLVPGKDRVVKDPVPVDDKGKGVDKLSVQPVTVLLTWKELPPGKPFKVQPVTKGTLPTGFTARSTTAQPPSILVRATTLNGKLPDAAVIETEPIDLTNRQATFTTTVKVVPPPGTTVSVEQVSVTVTIQESPQDRVFKGVPLAVQGRAVGADAAPIVTDVQVTIHGPYSIVSAVQPSQVTAYVDVEGLTPGKHQLPVKVVLPPGLTFDADPATVEVNVVAP